MYSYYSTDKIKSLNRERELQNSNNINIPNSSNSRPMNTSPSTPIPNSGGSNGSRFNLNSNNKNSGFSSTGKLQQQPQYHNNSQHQQHHNQQQHQLHHQPIHNRKPTKYKISYSVKNTINETLISDRHCFGVNSLALDLNKSTLYSAGRDSTIKSYFLNDNFDNNQNFKFKKSYDDHTDWVNDLFLKENDNILVSCSSDSTIKIWNTESDKCINSLKFHDDYVKVLAYTPKLNYFASSGLDSHIKIWDLNVCSVSQSFSIDNSNGNSNGDTILKHITTNCNNNNQISTPGSENTTETNNDSENDEKDDDNNGNSGGLKNNYSNGNFRNIDNIDEYTPPSSVLNHHNNHHNQHHTPIMKSTTTTNNCNNNNVNNNNNNKNINKFSPMFASGSLLVGKSGGEGISIYSLAIAEDASFVVSGSTERAIRGWDVRSGQKIFKLKGHTDNVRSIVLNSNSTKCLSASSDGTIRLWDIGEQRCIQVYDDLHTDSVWSLSVTDNFSHFFSGGRDGMIFLTDLKTNNSRLVARESEPILKILNSPLDKSIWVSTTNSTIKNYGLVDFYDKNNTNLNGIDNGGNSNGSGNNVLSSISAEDDNQVNEPIEPSTQIQGRSGIIKNQILNNKRHVLTKDNDGNVQLWDITKGKEIESYGKVDFDKKVEELYQIISIPKWFHVDTKTGSLFITLEFPLLFSADANQSNLSNDEEDGIIINIGESILYSLFSKWIKEHNLLLSNGSSYGNGNGIGLRDSNDSVNSDSSNTSSNGYNNSVNNSGVKVGSTNSNSNSNSPNIMIKKQIFQLPPNIDVVISEETSGLVLFRLKIEEFTGREQIEMIHWLFDCLTLSQCPVKKDISQKLAFSLTPDEKTICSTAIQLNGLQAYPHTQIRKICDHISKELNIFGNIGNTGNVNGNGGSGNVVNNILKPEEFIEIYFQNKLMPPHYTLATIKSFFWKQNGTIPLNYKIKSIYKNEIELKKYIKYQRQQQSNNNPNNPNNNKK